MNRKSWVFILLSILVIASAIRSYFALRCLAIPNFSDMGFYNKVAMEHGFPKSLPPGYPLFLRAIYRAFGAYNYRAVYFIQGIISSLTVLLIYFVARKVSNERAGLLAAGIAAIYPDFIAYNLTTMTETIGLFFVVLLFAILVATMSERRRSILAALTFFFAFTFRPVIVLFAPGVFLGLKRRWVFALASIIFLTPLVVFEMTAGKSFQRSAVAVYETYHPSLDGVQFVNPDAMDLGSDKLSSGVYLRTALANIAHNKWKAISNVYSKATVLFSRGWDQFVLKPIVGSSTLAYYVFTYAYIPVMIFGFIGMVRLYGRNNRMLALPALSYVMIVILFFLFKFRYRLLIEPVLIMYASMLIAGPVSAEPSGSERAEINAPDALRDKSNWDILAVILVLACALRIYFAFAYHMPAVSGEIEAYNRLALRGGLGSGSATLYPLFLRAIYALFGNGNYAAVFLAQGFLNVLAIVLLYTALARLAGGTAAVIAASICAVFPNFLLHNLSVGPESMSILLVASLMAVSTARFGPRARSSLTGALAALGVLLGPFLVCLIPGAFLAARRRRLFVLVAMLALVPFVAVNAVRTKKIEPVYETSEFKLGFENFAGPNALKNAIDGVYNNANIVASKWWGVSDTGTAFAAKRSSTNAAGYSYSIIMLLGLVGLARYYRKEQRAFVLPMLLYVVLLVLFSKFEIQYRAALEPVLIAYAAVLLAGRRRTPAACPGEP